MDNNEIHTGEKDCSGCPNREVCKSKCTEEIVTTIVSPLPKEEGNTMSFIAEDFTAEDIVDL